MQFLHGSRAIDRANQHNNLRDDDNNNNSSRSRDNGSGGNNNFMIIGLSAATYIIIIIIPQQYRASMTMARCSTPIGPIQNNYLELIPFCLVCNDNNCVSETTSAGSPSSTTSLVATDNCNIVDNVVFYINMLAQPNRRLPMPNILRRRQPTMP